MPLRSWDQLGQGRRFVSEARRVSPDLAAAGFQEMRPACAPTDAGRGDAVSSINRADSASGKLTVSMLRQLFGARDGSRNAGAGSRRAVYRKGTPAVSARLTGGYPMSRCGQLTHRRASLAIEAPIARPWISLSISSVVGGG